MSPVRLIVGLGNPGRAYEHTRHNIGACYVEHLSRQFSIPLKSENKFKARVGRGEIGGHDVRVMIPATYMNLSGEAVGPLAGFYKLAPEEILVAYDEMAFEPGVIRLKQSGGDNGHNGLRDIVKALGNSRSFLRLRIGVGHPGDPSRVTGYLTSVRMPDDERAAVERTWPLVDDVMPLLVGGDLARAMNHLHAPPQAPEPASQDGRDGI